ncbi:MAG: hypothetical protein Kow00106_15150 [Anaerolineae bacterium]
MFYGRVDVYWPDGPVESYRVNKPAVAVGRSTGNDIVLDTTSVSRYHIKFSFDESQAQLEDLDSANGTYVDGVRVPPHAPYPLRGGEEIQIGDIRLIYHPPSAATELMVSEETTQRVVLTRPTFRAELTGPDMAVAPGAHAQAVLTVENTGEDADHYFLEIDGLPKGWVRIDRVEMALEPGESAQAVLSFKPLRRSETRPGDYPFVVRARAKSRPAETIDIPAVLSVLPYSGFGMALEDGHLLDGEPFRVYLHNQGNTPLTLELGAMDPANALTIQLAARRAQLGPGERQTMVGEVLLRRRRLWGGPVQREFFIVARSHDPSGFIAAVPGTIVERGLLPAWVPLLLLPVMALALFVLAAVGLWVLGREDAEPPRPPVISAFAASRDEAVVGETVTLSWTVTDARSVVLRVAHTDEEQVIAIPPDIATHALTFDDSGRYTITLEAENDSQAVVQTLTLNVRPAVTLSVTVLGGADLVRHVSQEVQLTWEVRGARPYQGGYRIRITGSDRSGDLLVSPMPLSGQQRVTVVPGDDQAEWLVTLYAEGFDGLVASVVQKIPIVYPVCELRAAQTIVRSGPGERYPAILPPQPPTGALAGTLSYWPVARDPSGQWLQVPVSVEARLGWVPLADFACINFDPQRLIVTTDYPPPPATSTPAPSPTPLPTITPSPTGRTPTSTATPGAESGS